MLPPGTSSVNRPPRPMLSRVAESSYWMSRYLERSEHLARLLLTSTNLLLDMGDLDPAVEQQYWSGVLRILQAEHNPAAQALLAGPRETIATRVTAFFTVAGSDPNSLQACLTRARENARSIRENISSEMWENLNTLYWAVQGDNAVSRVEDAPQELLRQVLQSTMLFQGIADQSLSHGHGWHFIQLGKFLERAEFTCRILGTKAEHLRGVDGSQDLSGRHLHWMAVLRACGSVEAYRRNHFGETDPLQVASYLLLERHFPRSASFCIRAAHTAVVGIGRDIDPNLVGSAQRILGRANAELEYAQSGDLANDGIVPFTMRLQATVREAAMAIHKSYFLT